MAMTAKELNDYFHSLLPDYDYSKTVDKIIFGKEDHQVNRVLVVWNIGEKTIDYAITNGFDTIVTHEPTTWLHEDEHDIYRLPPFQRKSAAERIKRLANAGIAVIRNHDCWDHMPEIGIPWSWARFLGIESRPVDFRYGGCQQRYNIKPTKLGDLARYFTARTRTIGEDHLIVYGDLDQVISSVGIGTGSYCQLELFMEMGCDVSVVNDDGSWFCQGIVWAKDIGHPVIVASHATTEHPGMQSLASFMQQNLTEIDCEFRLYDLDKHFISK